MADSKITGLVELTSIASTDLLIAVDVSDTTMAATGTNKKVQIKNFILTNGTANTLGANLNVGSFNLSNVGTVNSIATLGTVNSDVLINGTVTLNSAANARMQFAENGTARYSLYYSVANGFFSFVENGVIDALSVKNGGNVGIGNTNPSYKLDVNGQCHASSFPTSSDIRLKDVQGRLKLTPKLKQKLNSINAYLFTWKDNYKAVDQFKRSNGLTKDLQVGFIAQEVQSAIPQLVTTWQHEGLNGEVIEDALAVDYTRFVPILWEAVKELYAENNDLRQRVTALESN